MLDYCHNRSKKHELCRQMIKTHISELRKALDESLKPIVADWLIENPDGGHAVAVHDGHYEARLKTSLMIKQLTTNGLPQTAPMTNHEIPTGGGSARSE